MKILDNDLSEIDNLYDKFIKMMIESFNNNYGVNIQNALSFINQIYKDLIVTNKKEKYPSIDYDRMNGFDYKEFAHRKVYMVFFNEETTELEVALY